MPLTSNSEDQAAILILDTISKGYELWDHGIAQDLGRSVRAYPLVRGLDLPNAMEGQPGRSTFM